MPQLDQVTPQLPKTPPCPFYFVLHLFSGQRREADVQFYIDELVAHSCLSIIVLSIDIVNDPRFGDLTNLGTVQFWM